MKLEVVKDLVCPFCAGDEPQCVLCSGSGRVTQAQIDRQAAKVGAILEDFLIECYRIPEGREKIDAILAREKAVAVQKAA